MRRNWDLIRDILLMADGRDAEQVKADLSDFGYTKSAVDFHLAILGEGKGDAGFIKESSTLVGGETTFHIDEMIRINMTKKVALHRAWKGEELKELIADSGVWEDIKAICRTQRIPLSETAIRTLANRSLMAMIDVGARQWQH